MAILHITFSLSTQASLKLAIRQNQLQREESVICVNDLFSIGPLTSLEERKDWLFTHILKDEDERELYLDSYKDWAKKIQGIPCDVDVWVWYGQNSHEEIGLRYVMSEFSNKCSMLFGIDATEGLKRIQSNMMIRHTGELSSDILMKLRADAKRFSLEEGNELAKEWHAIQESPSFLRVWQEGIVLATEDAYDSKIIEAAKRIHAKYGEEWISPTRVIGEIFSLIDDYINEVFMEKRIFILAEQGYFEIDGDPIDMYSYQIKYTGN